MQPDAPRPPRSSGVPRRPAVPGRPGRVPRDPKAEGRTTDATKHPSPKPTAKPDAAKRLSTTSDAAASATAATRQSKPGAAKPMPKAGAAKPDAASQRGSKSGSTNATKSSSKAPRSGRGGSKAPASGRSKARSGGAPAADRQGWLSGIRFSGFSLIMMGVLVLAVVVLAPTIAAFAQQRQQIAELRAAVSAQEAEVQRLRDERERWNDETFIMTQARERLYYVMPGEVSYLVIDDRSEAAKADATATVSAEVTESKGDWMRTLLDSVMTAGLAPAPSATDVPTEAPTDSPTGAPAEAPAVGAGR